MAAEPGLPNRERRKHPRVPDIFIVTYRLKSPFEVALKMKEKEYAAVAMDVSEGGLGVDVPQEIPVNTQVRLKFKMVNEFLASEQDRQRFFDLDGESRYCRILSEVSYRVGVLFKGVSAEDSAFIAKYVKDQALKKYID